MQAKDRYTHSRWNVWVFPCIAPGAFLETAGPGGLPPLSQVNVT
jgi:hypothetical protein